MENLENHFYLEKCCVQLIHEFLLCYKFNSTVYPFLEEASKLGHERSTVPAVERIRIPRDHILKLLTLFHSLDYLAFLEAWELLIPDTIQETTEYKRLTFYLHIYFAVSPLKTSQNYVESDVENNNVEISSTIHKLEPSRSMKEIPEEMKCSTSNLTRISEESQSPRTEYDTDSIDQSSVFLEQEKLVGKEHKYSSAGSKGVSYDTDSLDQSRVFMEQEQLSSQVENQQNQNKSIQHEIMEEEHDVDTMDQDLGSSKESEILSDILPSPMDILKMFLINKGPQYSSQTEFLTFFALPFVNNPKDHPSFENLYQDEWILSVKLRFFKFLEEYSYGDSVAPKLLVLYRDSVKKFPNNQPIMEDQNKKFKQLRKKFNKLHRDHQNLIGVAAELTGALENSVRGQAVDLNATLLNCAKIFPDLFAQSSVSQPEDFSQSQKVPVVVPLTHTKSLCCTELDVHKIKTHLSSASMKTKLLLLQALRWHITRGNTDERDQIISWISRYDVLSLHGDLVHEMIVPTHATTPHPLQQAIARLFNAIASLHTGRDYLASSQSLLLLLIGALKQEDGIYVDAITSDMILATLQKLSLRKEHRIVMIDKGLVEWLIMFLTNDRDRVYSLEYSSALFMNLCLHAPARERCPTSVLKLLTDLLNTQHTQIIPVVAGSLYCLLSTEEMNAAAQKMRLNQILAAHLENGNLEPHIRKQLETLIKVHQGDIPFDCVQTVCEETPEDELDDPDFLETELDADDPIRAMPGDADGRLLLETQYRRIFPSHGIVCPSSAKQDTISISVMPTTPRSRPPTRGS